MWEHHQWDSEELRSLIRKRKIQLGGNGRLKIYGKLNCSSGKRMKKENRVFFISESEAMGNGFRPCGHCMKKEYQEWKAKNNRRK